MKTQLTMLLARDSTFSYFARFVVVGCLNTALNYLVFLLLLTVFSVNYVLAGAIGFFSGAITGYVLNRNWTFKSDVAVLQGGIKYLSVQVVCLMAHIATQVSVVTMLSVNEMYSQLAGIMVTTFLNFYLSKKFVYAK